jgi:hypothetical protein
VAGEDLNDLAALPGLARVDVLKRGRRLSIAVVARGAGGVSAGNALASV